MNLLLHIVRILHIVRSGRAVLPIRMVHAFNGKSSLPVYECKETGVKKSYCRFLSFSEQRASLSFSAWRFAHAVKKAECTRWSSSRILWPESIGFLFESIHLFNWNSTEFRLNSGMSDFYADFSRTSLSGRVGQGMALLFLEDRGYLYVGRFSAKRKLRRSPDFVIENSQKEQALAEAKGSFVSLGKGSNVKKVLKNALDQLDGWDKCLSPQPHKSFAIGTFLRETGDSHRESSLTAFVETKFGKPQGPEKPQGPFDFPQDAIRRANYASWLSLMGFDDAARRLQEREGDPREHIVPCFALGEHQYMVTIVSTRSSYRHDAHESDFQRLTWKAWHLLDNPWNDSAIIEIIGLKLDVVLALGSALRDPGSQALMEIELSELPDIPSELDRGTFYGSAFFDGSLIGEIEISHMDLRLPDFEWIEVVL